MLNIIIFIFLKLSIIIYIYIYYRKKERKFVLPLNKLIGHRFGNLDKNFENTIEAFKYSLNNGFNWFEMDVQITKDNELVIFHDDALHRMTNNIGFLYEKTYDEICQIKIRGKYNIPKLDEIFEINYNPENIVLNLELKIPEILLYNTKNKKILNDYRKRLVDNLYNCICNKIDKYNILFSSFDLNSLEYLYSKLNNKQRKQVKFEFLCEKQCHWVTSPKLKIDFCGIDKDYVDYKFIHKLNRENIKVLVYTVNDIDLYNNLIYKGAYAVFTDILLTV
jgi:glycerophosphoryl diester phosphodiesterase